MVERPAVNRKAAGSIPAVPVFLELRPMGGHLSYTQRMQVRFLQLRSCFSGATEAQLFRNQQAVGSNPTGSSYMQVSRNGNAPLCQGGFTGSSPVTCFCPCGVTASTSAFQADDPGSIPGTGFAGEWNGIPFQPHTLKIAGSTPVPAIIAEWSDR